MKSLHALGEQVASALLAAQPERERAIELARQGFVREQLGQPPSQSLFSTRLAWAGGAGLAVLAVLLLVLTQHNAGAITFKVGGSAGALNSWLAAPERGALELAFSEGTRIRLEAASRARVVDSDAHGASVALEGGRLHADVVHQRDSAWRVIAGPFTVYVRGTVFDVSWDPLSEKLRVSVTRGLVAVRESSTGAQQDVRAFETLSTTASQHHFDVTRVDGKSAAEARAIPAVSASLAAPEPPRALLPSLDARDNRADDRAKGAPPKSDAAAADGWRGLLARGAVREAFAQAKAAGFSEVCAGASPAELLSLGDGARLSGKSDDANLALLTLRRRYPSDSRRAAAAFSLGKVAFDQRRAYEQAVEWFVTSLREQPGGPLAREASGRLIEASSRAGDTVGAQRAARDYLKKYPEGPHADLARTVLR